MASAVTFLRSQFPSYCYIRLRPLCTTYVLSYHISWYHEAPSSPLDMKVPWYLPPLRHEELRHVQTVCVAWLRSHTAARTLTPNLFHSFHLYAELEFSDT